MRSTQIGVGSRTAQKAAGPAARPGSAPNSSTQQPVDCCVPEEGLAAVEEAITIRQVLAARWPDAYQNDLDQSVEVRAWLEGLGDEPDLRQDT
jgi:hypothetical protein